MEYQYFFKHAINKKDILLGFLLLIALCFKAWTPTVNSFPVASKGLVYPITQYQYSGIESVLLIGADVAGPKFIFSNAAIMLSHTTDKETEGVHFSNGLAFLKRKELAHAKKEFQREDALFPDKEHVSLKIIEIHFLLGLAPEPLILELFHLFKNNGVEDVNVYLGLVHDLMSS